MGEIKIMPDIVIPNVLIIGFSKCGTTSLFEWLSEHPEVCASNRKETYYLSDFDNPFYSPENNYEKKGKSGYRQYFQNYDKRIHKVTLEATPSYVYEKRALEFSRAHRGRIKVIVLVREPSERIYSCFNFAKHNSLHLDLNLQFSDFVELCKKYKRPVKYKESVESISFNSFDTSAYVDYLLEWADAVGTENLYIYKFEDLSSPVKLMKKISVDLGIASSFWGNKNLPVMLRTFGVKSRWLHRFVIGHGMVFSRIFPKKIRNFMLRFYKKINTVPLDKNSNPSDLKLLASINSEYREKNEKLAREFKIDLGGWTR